jgi:uncharacterized protein (UPF0179 family)
MDHVLVVLGLAVALVVFVYVSPTKACRKCAGQRGPCGKCRGTGRRFRVGARLVRRALLALRKEWKERDRS